MIILISTNLNACAKGQFADADKSNACTDCPLNTYSTTTDAVKCTDCEAGKEAKAVKAEACTACAVDTDLLQERHVQPTVLQAQKKMRLLV